MKSAGICEMCAHHVGLRQKAHIVAEERDKDHNIVLLCPTCRIMFDTHLKPKVLRDFWKQDSRICPSHGRRPYTNKRQRHRQELWEERR
jgi:hypothetical protein